MPRFTGLKKGFEESESFKSLSVDAKLFYLYLRNEYYGSNNGRIEFPHATMKGVLGCSSNTAISTALRELVNKKWIKIEEKGSLYRFDNLYTLTFRHDYYGITK